MAVRMADPGSAGETGAERMKIPCSRGEPSPGPWLVHLSGTPPVLYNQNESGPGGR